MALSLLAAAVAACGPLPPLEGSYQHGPYYGPGYGPGYGPRPPMGQPQATPAAIAEQFWRNAGTMCGRSFPGRLVSQDPADAAFANKTVRMGPVACAGAEIRIPVAVGPDRSRTWVLRRKPGGLQLKHIHLKASGKEDEISWYGGHTLYPGTMTRQEFPADDFSKNRFREQKRPESVENVWAVEIVPNRLFAYELRRQQRFFRLEFDLQRPKRRGAES